MAWNPDTEEEHLLRTDIDQMELLKPGQHGNDVYLVTFTDGTSAVFKPQAGERTAMGGVPSGTLHLREVAAYRLDRVIGFALVPATVARDVANVGVGALQAHVESDGLPIADYPDEHDRHAMATLDYLLGSGDRGHPGNWMTQSNGRPSAIDNGLSMSTQPVAAIGSAWTQPMLNQPVCRSVAELVLAVDADGLAQTLRDAEIEEPAIDAVLFRLQRLQAVTLSWP